MIPKECKRLAEVDFPIAVVSKHSAREKSIRHGHPSTLHLWWARRPLAACRAMLLGLLLPDPCDPHCPADFKKRARALLPKVAVQPGAKDEDLRKGLLTFIGDFANWDNSAHPVYLEVGRGLVKAAHPEETPLVVDPFAGGGSIPLEALRLGCEAFASDLNPVACLILKVLLEDIPRYGNADFKLKDDRGKEVTVHGLANALRHVGAQIKKAAEKELAEFYPPDPDGARPIAYLWARTVRCEAPNCGCEIPLARSFWLCKKSNRKRALRYRVVNPSRDRKGAEAVPHVEFEVFEPKSDKDVPPGTVSRAKAACSGCGTVLGPHRVRAQLAAQRGGADVVFDAKGNRTGGARLLAVVALRQGEPGRHYRVAADRDYQAVRKAMQRLKEVAAKPLPNGLSSIPDEPTPAGGGSGAARAFSVQKYGMLIWSDLFSARQLLALEWICRAIRKSLAPAGSCLALGKLVDLSNSICRWEPVAECPRNVFGAGRVKPPWEFAEGIPISDSSGGFMTTLENTARAIESVGSLASSSSPQIADATASPLPGASCGIWFTDPPYYDAIPYSDLSNFFLVWFKRVVHEHTALRDPFDRCNPLAPKLGEIIQDETQIVDGAPKDRVFFERQMAKAFAEGRRILDEGGVGCVVFAHKTTEGWEALLSGMIRGGWVITGSWPLATECASRLRAKESAALATSIHLVCRPRPGDAEVGDWSTVYRVLPKRVGDWMERLQAEGIRGADLVFACIGPALEIYSQYSKVVDNEDREIPLGGDPEAAEPHRRGFLAYVWETVGRCALQQILGTAEAKARNSAAGALEEDARLTALFLWTLQATNGKGVSTAERAENAEDEAEEGDEEERPKRKPKGLSLIYDVARRFAQPLGIHLEEWEGRIIETEKGVVRLLPVEERARQLFGDEGAGVAAGRIEADAERDPQAAFAFMQRDGDAAPEIRGRRKKRAEAGAAVSDEHLRARREATTLDRVHAAMLLQAAGRTNALRALLKAEQERGPDFERLANALTALYPNKSEERRLLEAMAQAMPR